MSNVDACRSDHRALLEVSDLAARYGRARVLTGVTFSVAPGEAVVLLGRNGAGKSTALKAIMGLEVEHRDERFPAKEWVLGLRLGGAARAWPFSVLVQRVDAEGRLRERVGGQDIEIRYDRAHRSAAAYDAAGQALPSVTAYWFAWVAFNPKTSVLTAH